MCEEGQSEPTKHKSSHLSKITEGKLLISSLARKRKRKKTCQTIKVPISRSADDHAKSFGKTTLKSTGDKGRFPMRRRGQDGVLEKAVCRPILLITVAY